MLKYLLFLLLPACSFWIEPQDATYEQVHWPLSAYRQAADTAVNCLALYGHDAVIDPTKYNITSVRHEYSMFGTVTLSHFLPPNTIQFTTEVLTGCQADEIATTNLAYEFVRSYVINVLQDFGKSHPCFEQLDYVRDYNQRKLGVVCNNIRIYPKENK